MVVLLSLTLLAGVGCRKSVSDPELPDQAFRVKIIDELCGNAVVQIQDTAFFALGVDGYVKADTVYHHVFTTRFSCEDISKMQTLTADKSGMVIRVRLIREAKPEPGCVTCAATLSNAPPAFHLLTLVNYPLLCAIIF